jgi:hypothetical protein
MQMKGAEELLNKRDELYKNYLEADKDERREGDALTYKAQMDALDYVLGRRNL